MELQSVSKAEPLRENMLATQLGGTRDWMGHIRESRWEQLFKPILEKKKRALWFIHVYKH